MRKPLPDRRKSQTFKLKVDGLTCHLTCGTYEDGSLGDIFLDASKFGTFSRGALDAFAKTFSIALQCGAELTCLLDALRGTNFPPQDERCSSIIDLVVQILEVNYGHISRPAANGADDQSSCSVRET